MKVVSLQTLWVIILLMTVIIILSSVRICTNPTIHNSKSKKKSRYLDPKYEDIHPYPKGQNHNLKESFGSESFITVITKPPNSNLKIDSSIETVLQAQSNRDLTLQASQAKQDIDLDILENDIDDASEKLYTYRGY